MPSAAPLSPQIAHNVYFSLHDSSDAARRKLVDACRKYLSGHPGAVYFGVGLVSESLARPANDRDFDVGLHLVFRSMADHDAYQEHPRHLQFIEENKPAWKRVRVFDSEVT